MSARAQSLGVRLLEIGTECEAGLNALRLEAAQEVRHEDVVLPVGNRRIRIAHRHGNDGETQARGDLERAHALFLSVTATDPEYAAGWTGLGIAELQYVRHGFGGQIHVMHARRAFDEALKLDPASTEANLYRIYMLLSRGEKESARHGIANLLTGAANDWNVHMVAGIALRGDGMYDEALHQFNRALKLNPANAAILYNHRARVYHYQNQIELAGDELEKGLALEPRHPLLRTSAGYQQMRVGNLNAAMAILESATGRRSCRNTPTT